MRTCLLPWILCAVFAAALAPAAGETFDIPPLQGISVDGNADDWGDRGFAVNVLWDRDRLRPGPDDFYPRMRLGWDERGLLVLVLVRDETHVSAAGDELVHGDHVEVALASPQQAGVFYQLAAALPASGQKLATLETDHRGEGAAPLDYTAAGARTPEGYAIEFLLPWSSINTAGEAGDEVAFTAKVVDVDAPGGPRSPAVWHPSDRAKDGAVFMHRVRLAEHASPPVNTIAAVDEFGTTGLGRLTIYAAQAAEQRFSAALEGETVIEGTLLNRDEQGWIQRVIPMPHPLGQFTVSVDGQPIDVELFGHPLDLQLSVAIINDAAGLERLTSSLSFEADDLAAQEVTLSVSDVDGRTVATHQARLYEPVELELEAGVYAINAQVDLLGQPVLKRIGIAIGPDAQEQVKRILDRANAFAQSNAASPYRPRVAHLLALHQKLAARDPAAAMAWIVEMAVSLHEANIPGALAQRRGAFIWAHHSDVDDTAQPFRITVPQSYNPDQPTALYVHLHGRGGTHENRMVVPPPPNAIAVSPFGRSRRGGYHSLGAVDVLDTLAFVKEHWNIDPDRIYISGASMGGGGSLIVAGLFPDLFAAVRPTCGYLGDIPVENLLHVPVGTLHSDDDHIIPIAESRAPAARLTDIGGEVIRFETTGYEHHVDYWQQGGEASLQWMVAQKRTTKPHRVLFRAVDQLARQAWWVQVIEWGPQHNTADVDARLGEGNTLYLNLHNGHTVRFDLAASPADTDQPLRIVLDGVDIANVPAPLPAHIWLTQQQGSPTITTEPPVLPDYRLHYPGGMPALYHGEPLLIIYGTGGDDARDEQLLGLAQAIARTPHARWDDVADMMDYGSLPMKPDTDVTAEDLQTRNVILLGTAEENAIVAQLTAQLPVRIQDGQIISTDGDTWAFDDVVLGLLHYNPAAPQRLIYWIASDRAEGYGLTSPLPSEMYGPAAADLLITRTTARQLVAARTFDSRWKWSSPAQASAPLPTDPPAIKSARDAFTAAFARAARADIVAYVDPWDEHQPRYVPGVTRHLDLINSVYYLPLVRVQLTGAQIRELQHMLSETAPRRGQSPLIFATAPGAPDLVDDVPYWLAVRYWDLSKISAPSHPRPARLEQPDSDFKEVMEDFARLNSRESASGHAGR